MTRKGGEETIERGGWDDLTPILAFPPSRGKGAEGGGFNHEGREGGEVGECHGRHRVCLFGNLRA